MVVFLEAGLVDVAVLWGTGVVAVVFVAWVEKGGGLVLVV